MPYGVAVLTSWDYSANTVEATHYLSIGIKSALQDMLTESETLQQVRPFTFVLHCVPP